MSATEGDTSNGTLLPPPWPTLPSYAAMTGYRDSSSTAVATWRNDSAVPGWNVFFFFFFD